MIRYYFYKKRLDIREDLKGNMIDFSLSALYSTKGYSQKFRKEISQFHYFDQIHLCISTKTKGIFQIDVDSGTDGCMGHYSKSLNELKESFSKYGYCLISERNYFRLRKLAMRLIFKNIQFFIPENDEAFQRKYLYQTNYSSGFYDITLISTSEKYNIRNYDENQIEYGKKIGIPMNDLRINEYFRIFISKDKNYKANKFSVESNHFNPYYQNYQEFINGNFLRKDKNIVEIKDFQFARIKKMVVELILDRSDLDISSIIPKQQHTITILDI
ncbi:hypothetical protein CMT75_18690 [Elizabethkingia anophelis]|nr:hypothetical protein [Elizabethkingia anophelis]